MNKPPTFYHFTDAKHAQAIHTDHSVLMPGGPLNVVWLTSLQSPVLAGAPLCLTPERVAWRFQVKPGTDVKPWTMVCDNFPPELWWPMELAAGARPELWYVATHPIEALFGVEMKTLR